jgi:predicted metal-dependent peptidase
MPAHVEEMLEEMLNPSVDWKAVLRRFLTEVSEDDHSLARPDRRFISEDVYLPGRFGEDSMGEMAVVMDTSGSVSDDELGQFFSEMASAVAEVSPDKLIVVYCDADVAHVDEFEQPSEAEVTSVRKRYGGGGTTMPVGIQYVEDNYPHAKAIVVLTDGGTPWGEPSRIPTLWAITEEARVPDWGEHVHVELNADG